MTTIPQLHNLATAVADKLNKHDVMLATAESCTGGQVAYVLTSLPGSSDWFERGFVTYSNQAKFEMLGVPSDIIAKYGAVSEQTAVAMAEGAIKNSHAQVSVSITGVAGPSGGSTEKPVGTVWIAWAQTNKKTKTELFHFNGDREHVRNQAVLKSLFGIIELL